jgi:glyoxalase
VFRPIFAYANKNVYLCIAGVMAYKGRPLTITIDVGLVRMVFDGAENVLREKAEHAIKTN